MILCTYLSKLWMHFLLTTKLWIWQLQVVSMVDLLSISSVWLSRQFFFNYFFLYHYLYLWVQRRIGMFINVVWTFYVALVLWEIFTWHVLFIFLESRQNSSAFVARLSDTKASKNVPPLKFAKCSNLCMASAVRRCGLWRWKRPLHDDWTSFTRRLNLLYMTIVLSIWKSSAVKS